jgi:hypothetical protein
MASDELGNVSVSIVSFLAATLPGAFLLFADSKLIAGII